MTDCLEDDSGKVGLLTSSRDFDRARGLGRTGARRFASSDQALARAQAFVSRLPGASSLHVDTFKYELDRRAFDGSLVPGTVTVRYSTKKNGYRFVVRTCGVSVFFDPQDGELLAFSCPPDPPPVTGPTTPAITREEAYRAALGRLPEPLDKSELGYAVPKGETHARLCWEIRLPKVHIYVDAVTGRRVKEIVFG